MCFIQFFKVLDSSISTLVTHIQLISLGSMISLFEKKWTHLVRGKVSGPANWKRMCDAKLRTWIDRLWFTEHLAFWRKSIILFVIFKNLLNSDLIGNWLLFCAHRDLNEFFLSFTSCGISEKLIKTSFVPSTWGTAGVWRQKRVSALTVGLPHKTGWQQRQERTLHDFSAGEFFVFPRNWAPPNEFTIDHITSGPP